ncbi:Required for the activity of the bacterial periplasmic transport system of putrescine [Vibrio sp. B1REV9]|uniref:extracellular solute-binding protein n=1 Tax=Vibrio TaxID=662 RepID=UPI001B22F415|nr:MULTISPECIES: extracellular solute-binding protein [Vibrio]WQE77074.1 extracellular solute-binding protein [Vibrio alfacsensis]CAE6950069.1 Required for the activity of the bacterial periplasmic transport system of putrescine [Vibrio sp. B1REV9]
MKNSLVASALVGLLSSSPVWASTTLNIYNWSEYLPQSIIEDFTKETGIKVNYATFESNETMYAKLKLIDGEGYDIVVPSTYYVSKLANDGLLHRIDKSKIDSFSQLDSSIMNQSFDPQNQYSLPYMWGSTAIGYNSDVVDGSKLTGWADLWNSEYAGQLLLTDDVRDVMGMSLILGGHSVNSQDPKELQQAYDRLTKLKPNVMVFNSDAPHVPLITGEVNVGMQWNGTAYRALQENPAIRFVYPQEGAIFWMDNIVIPEKAQNKDAAYTFINFLLRPENQAEVVKEIGYAVPNLQALTHLPAEIRDSEIIFPSEDVKKKGQFLGSVGDAVGVYERYWMELKK